MCRKSSSNVIGWKITNTAIFHNHFIIAVVIAPIASFNRLYFFCIVFSKNCCVLFCLLFNFFLSQQAKKLVFTTMHAHFFFFFLYSCLRLYCCHSITSTTALFHLQKWFETRLKFLFPTQAFPIPLDSTREVQ